MSLEKVLGLLETAVTDVTAVQVNDDKGLGCYGSPEQAVTAVTESPRKVKFVTAVTAEEKQPLQLEPAPLLGCTAVTAVTSETTRPKTISDPKPLPPADNRYLWRVAGRTDEWREVALMTPLIGAARMYLAALCGREVEVRRGEDMTPEETETTPRTTRQETSS